MHDDATPLIDQGGVIADPLPDETHARWGQIELLGIWYEPIAIAHVPIGRGRGDPPSRSRPCQERLTGASSCVRTRSSRPASPRPLTPASVSALISDLAAATCTASRETGPSWSAHSAPAASDPAVFARWSAIWRMAFLFGLSAFARFRIGLGFDPRPSCTFGLLGGRCIARDQRGRCTRRVDSARRSVDAVRTGRDRPSGAGARYRRP